MLGEMWMKAEFSIAGRRIANDSRCFVIAEAGVNHNGEAELAHRLVDAVADAKADAIKFQTFNADALVTGSARRARYQVDNTGSDSSQFEMIKALELPAETFLELREHALRRGLLFISTPFDEASADVLDGIGVPAFKVSSGDLNNHQLLEHIAAKGKPMIISTGMATLGEIDDALRCLAEAGAAEVCALQCTSSYPAPPDQINLRVMETLRRAFGIPIGYSDHTIGIPVSVAAAALGAAVIEKHVTLDRNLPGPDHRASLEPAELTRLLMEIREVEDALGSPVKRPVPVEEDTRDVARRSLFAGRNIAAGSIIVKADLVALRPGTGISPDRRHAVLGQKARHNIPAGTALTYSDLQ